MADARKVMLVSEDAAVRKRFDEALAGKGFDLVAVPSGEEALWQLERESCDAIFAAAALGGMGGLELAEEARARHGGLPVYILGGGGADGAEALPAMPTADALTAIAERLAPARAAGGGAAAPAAAGSGSRLKDVVLFLLAPLVALGYILAFPIVGFVVLVYSMSEANGHADARAAPGAAAPVPKQSLAKAFGMMFAVAVIGVLYGLIAPILGIMLVLWFGMEAWGKLGKKAVGLGHG
jgi:CheY-like chemotaxis protein